ncbi:SCO family protein [Chelativorans sp. ZYF759]|uniref:SCO family protein n=1 Tax=Chelativorans sp. ZYF759 TaxID=2692213 RepID=UPI00145DD5FB|nr:SCO family protein [Chelativorans sp. ZYF759]NMG41512.1 SCO family protein [Chelativorans sp. ZYF759]
MMRIILVGILVVMTAAVGWITFDWYRGQHMSRTFGEPFVLVDHNGDEITEAAFRGHPSAVFFGFTYCPDVCPTTLFELDGWLNELGPEGENIRAYFVSVDPERDSPEVLGRYIANVTDKVTGITGEAEDVAQMARSFGIYVRKVDLENGDYTIDHTASILMIDSTGDFAGTIAYGENPDNAMAKLRRLAGS